MKKGFERPTEQLADIYRIGNNKVTKAKALLRKAGLANAAKKRQWKWLVTEGHFLEEDALFIIYGDRNYDGRL